MKEEVVIGIGSNLGDRPGNCVKAIQRLDAHPDLEVLKVSSFYETEPVDAEGGWFVNAVALLETSLDPFWLLTLFKGIEREMGRPEAHRRGTPRTIDLDLLLYGRRMIQTKELVIPHPRMHKRRFVLLPLYEIAPKVEHPLLKRTAEELLLTLQDPSRVRLLPMAHTTR
ncbi:MAG: 2-amino-4-hydroxy-6-hydroxymethyldihydropteridine diphosphokinase [candidate division NC10 bacterium]|nr:2-amino-4-hydroxy-6-hydroxymethyldihydropteridine diphosphokinase [candidate division NC10 bacterium]